MSGVEVVASWFTPTVLFCVLNLMIGTIFITSSLKKQQIVGGEHPPQLVRVPSFFERVKSFNLSRSQPDPAAQDQEPEAEEPRHVARSKSSNTEAKPATPTPTPAARILKKSASEKVSAAELVEVDPWRPATVREKTAAEDEAVDAKADDFINRFRQQLKLQRMDSILRYKEMLNRGTAR